MRFFYLLWVYMKLNYAKIIAKIDKAIINYGIPQYISKWIKIDIPEKFKSYTDFVIFLQKYVKVYHFHSLINSPKLQSDNMNQTENRPFPEFEWDLKNKIGTIKFYHFYNSADEKKNNDTANKIIDLVETNLNKWIDRNINGLIIDLREHQGGNMWPHVQSLKNILGDTTLLSFTNKNISHNTKKWVNLRNGKVFHNEKFMSKSIKFKKPIAVLVSKNTTSSGEFIAGIFYKRNNVKLFGEKTGGYFSVNRGFKINDDILLFLTVALCKTVDGTLHVDERLYVDVKTNNPISSAKKWIMSK